MTPASKAVAALVGKVRKAVQAAFFSTFLALTPVPAPRPRVTRFGGVYYGKPYAAFMASAQKDLAALKDVCCDKPVLMIMEVVCERPRTGKLDLPKGDVDNHAKGPMDAATKAGTLWRDDTQVAALFVAKRYAEPGEEPGVHLSWAPLPGL